MTTNTPQHQPEKHDAPEVPSPDVLAAQRRETHKKIGDVFNGTVDHTAFGGRNVAWSVGRGVRFVVDGVFDVVSGLRKKPSPRTS